LHERRTNFLDKIFLYRLAMERERYPYTEFETNILIAIRSMNHNAKRCSSTTVASFLAKYHRTPGKQQLLIALRKFKANGLLRVNGVGPATNYHLSGDGQEYLSEIESRLRMMRL
jgi:hypothetical protein